MLLFENNELQGKTLDTFRYPGWKPWIPSGVTNTQRILCSYHRQAVAIPAKPPVHVETALVSEPCDDILYRASQNVAVMRETSSKGRAIVERVPASINAHQLSVNHNPTRANHPRVRRIWTIGSYGIPVLREYGDTKA